MKITDEMIEAADKAYAWSGLMCIALEAALAVVLDPATERDAEVAAKAWALCDATITEHLVGNTAITAAIASGWPENPYRKAVES